MNYAVGSGWHALLNEYLPKIKKLGGQLQCNPYEKYGTLQIDVYPLNNDMITLLNELENKSETICEICGSPGVLREKQNWIKTLCSYCLTDHLPL